MRPLDSLSGRPESVLLPKSVTPTRAPPPPLRPPEGSRYLCQLQHHGVVHVELSRDGLNEVGAAHGDDAEASAQRLQFLDGPDQVISEGRKSRLKTPGTADPAATQFQLWPSGDPLTRLKRLHDGH